MKVRQIYIDEYRHRAFAGSIGIDLKNSTSLSLSFNTDNEKIITFTLKRDTSDLSIEKFIDSLSTDYAIVAYINDVMSSLILHHSGLDSEYSIDKNTIQLTSGSSPSMTVDGIIYTANNEGKMIKYCHSKFIDKESNVLALNKANQKCTYAEDAEAVKQYLQQHLAIIKNELWYNYMYGLPLMQSGVTKAMIDAEVAMIIFECRDVESILDFNSYIDNHGYHLSFSLMTKYGKLDLIDTL